MRYDGTALAMMGKLPRFEKNQFENWVRKQTIFIGANHVMQYIEEKARWQTKANASADVDNFRIDYSAQAKNIIGQQDQFDMEDCKIWFMNAIELTKGDILNYLNDIKK